MRRRKDYQFAFLLRCRSRDFEECADADWIGERRREPHALPPDGGGVARESRKGVWRREGHGYRDDVEEGLSTEEDSDTVLHVQWHIRAEWPLHAKQRGEDGEAEV